MHAEQQGVIHDALGPQELDVRVHLIGQQRSRSAVQAELDVQVVVLQDDVGHVLSVRPGLAHVLCVAYRVHAIAVPAVHALATAQGATVPVDPAALQVVALMHSG